MTINYQFGDVDDHGAMIRAQAGLHAGRATAGATDQ